MSDYAQTTQFTAKDTLPSGALARRIKGSEHDVELAEIRIAVATKADAADNGVALATKTASLDVDSLTSETIVVSDKLAVVDADASDATVEVTLEDLATAIAPGTTGGIGEVGGILDLYFESVTDATLAAADEFLIADVSAADALAKVTPADLPAVLAGAGYQNVSGKMGLDINGLDALTSIDSLNDEFAFANMAQSDDPRKGLTTYRSWCTALWQVGLDYGQQETDDVLESDYRVYLGDDGELRRMLDHHTGYDQIVDLPHFMNIEPDDGPMIINTTGGAALWAFLAGYNYPIGYEITLVNSSLSDTVALYPGSGEWMASVHRIGVSGAGAVTVLAGGVAKAVQTVATVWHVSGDIS